jgi:hypothetical protein
MADINAIAQQFTDFYYQAFDSDRSGLRSLYVRRHLIPLVFGRLVSSRLVSAGSSDIDLLMADLPFLPSTFSATHRCLHSRETPSRV